MALIAILSVTFALTSCSKNEIETGINQTNNTSIIDDGNREARPIILGKQLNNPYSIENMQAALDTLKAHPEQHSTCMKAPSATLEGITIQPTDKYVRFLPADSTQFVKLMTDSTLILFDYPLDYQKEQTGDYYKDPTVEGKFTWLYTSVPIGYQPPSGIRYEVIKELFIPEHSPYYSQQETPSNIKGIQHIKSYTAKQANYADVLKTLEAVSFILTGNGNQLNKPTTGNAPVGMQKATSYVTKRFLWTSWQEAVYNPEGYLKVSTPNGDLPLANIRVRVARWFTAYETRTNLQGKFYFYDQFGQDAIFPNIEYFVFFDGYNGVNSWKLCDALFGAAVLWTTGISIGVHSPDNYSMTFNTSSYYWGECVQHKALNDYMNIARADGISLPPTSMDIASLNDPNYTSGTPMMKNTLNWSIVDAYPNFWGVVGQVFATSLLYAVYPDIMLRYQNNMADYQIITYFAWHELTHASMVKRLISEKGIFWASGYWSANVYQQAYNSLYYTNPVTNRKSPYGAKGDANWQIIALSEGWANYREWLLKVTYLNPYYSIANEFPRNYGYMFRDLVSIGCSYSNIEKSLAAYTISDFKNNLITIYPTLKDKITEKIKFYE